MILQGTKSIMGLNYGRTFAIGIPKEWVLHHDLNQKDKLLYVADEVLIIYPEKSKVDMKKLLEAIKPKEGKKWVLNTENLKETKW